MKKKNLLKYIKNGQLILYLFPVSEARKAESCKVKTMSCLLKLLLCRRLLGLWA